MGCPAAPAYHCLRLHKSRRQAGICLWTLPAPAVLCFPERAEDFSKQLYHPGYLCEKGFSMPDRGDSDITEDICQGAYGSFAQMPYSAGADHPAVSDHPLFSRFEGRSGVHKGRHEAAGHPWDTENRVPACPGHDFGNNNCGGTVCRRCHKGD